MIHDWNSVVEKHAQTMLQLLEFGMRGTCWETWRTGADCEYSSFADCGRDRRGEQILDCVWSSILNLYFEEIEVLPA